MIDGSAIDRESRVPQQHAWNVTPMEARKIQREWSVRVSLEPLGNPDFRSVTGLDIHYQGDTAFAAAVTLSLPDLKVTETRRMEARADYPYISGLLAFREVPILLSLVERLEKRPEVLLADGHGTAHPRRFGMACHLGILLDIPTVGVARKHLWGVHAKPGNFPGDRSWLEDQGQRIGAVLRTRRRVAPVFVSPGHGIDLTQAVELVMACLQGYRQPEPLRLAGILAG